MAAKKALWGYLFISPWVLGLLVFTLAPIIFSAYTSFTRYTILKPPRWVGARNYVDMFTRDPLFWKSLGNTAYYVAFQVPLRVALGFALALLLNSKIKWRATLRTAYYVPCVVPVVATSMVWIWIFRPHTGFARYFLGLFGIPNPGWMTSEVWSKPTLIIVSLWTIGSTMVIYLAGLQDIPITLLEAAEVDGASRWAKLTYIMIPMMTPTIFFNLVMGIIGAFQAFTYAFLFSGGTGDPLNSTLFYTLYVYRNAFGYIKMGYASALSWIMFFIIMLVTLVVFSSARRWVFYWGEQAKAL